MADLAKDIGTVVVFSPHPDDEVLGCGGTIAKCLRDGANVYVVYVTNGDSSHPHELIRPERLAAIRKEEALAGLRVLGLDFSRVRFLDFPDSELPQHRREVAEAIDGVLDELAPGAVFYPYRRDRHPDHLEVSEVVRERTSRRSAPTTHYQYAVHFYRPWPYGAHLSGKVSAFSTEVKRALGVWVRLRTELTCRVNIEEFLAKKREAIACHMTQMTRYVDSPGWWSLPEVGEGRFLWNFLENPTERFHVIE